MPSTHRFTNKTAIVTGGTTGIGFATAQALIEEGARVIITGQNEERLATAAKKLGPNAIAVRTDVRKVEDLDALARRAREVFDRVDILFANAGVGAFAPLEHQTRPPLTASSTPTSRGSSSRCRSWWGCWERAPA